VQETPVIGWVSEVVLRTVVAEAAEAKAIERQMAAIAVTKKEKCRRVPTDDPVAEVGATVTNVPKARKRCANLITSTRYSFENWHARFARSTGEWLPKKVLSALGWCFSVDLGPLTKMAKNDPPESAPPYG